METGRILFETSGALGQITIAHERRRNALTLQMWSDLAVMCAECERDPAVRVIVLRGAGRVAFSAGADISEFPVTRATPEAVDLYERTTLAAHRALMTVSKPTVALVDGLCYGGGMGLAMACDVRLSSDRSSFCIPAARLGIGYGFDDVLMLAGRIGAATTADLLLSGIPMSAADARAGGLVQRIWPAAEFERQAGDYIAAMAGNAPLTMAAVKRALAATAFRPTPGEMADMARLVAACDASQDFLEGQTAFREKRAPRFTGQ